LASHRGRDIGWILRVQLLTDVPPSFTIKVEVLNIYRVIQEERLVFWEVIVPVLMRKKVHMNMCLILNGAEIELFESTNTKAL
jgi:hypothetical protein